MNNVIQMSTNKWAKFLDTIKTAQHSFNEDGEDIIFFRGQANKNFKLLPSILRLEHQYPYAFENSLYYDFITDAGSEIANNDSWEILYKMRHHGIPTRLIDWTTNFAVSLFFALDSKELNEPHICMLKPSKLLAKSKGLIEFGLSNPSIESELDYFKNYVNRHTLDNYNGLELPIPILPNRVNDRMVAQKGVFTLHGNNTLEIEQLANDCLLKFTIPEDCYKEAREFLNLVGIDDYFIYPDLDGLSRKLNKKHNLTYKDYH